MMKTISSKLFPYLTLSSGNVLELVCPPSRSGFFKLMTHNSLCFRCSLKAICQACRRRVPNITCSSRWFAKEHVFSFIGAGPSQPRCSHGWTVLSARRSVGVASVDSHERRKPAVKTVHFMSFYNSWFDFIWWVRCALLKLWLAFLSENKHAYCRLGGIQR